MENDLNRFILVLFINQKSVSKSNFYLLILEDIFGKERTLYIPVMIHQPKMTKNQ